MDYDYDYDYDYEGNFNNHNLVNDSQMGKQVKETTT